MIGDPGRQPSVAADNVGAQSLARLRQGALLERGDDIVVFGDDAVEVLHALPMQQLRNTLVIAEPPIGIHHERVVGQPDQQFVESGVLVDEVREVLEGLPVVMVPDVVVDRDEFAEHALVDVVNADIKRAEFEHDTRFEEVGDFFGIGGRCDTEALVRLVDHEALCGQSGERFADRNDRRTELAREVGQVHFLAFTQFAHHDAAIDLVMSEAREVRLSQQGAAGFGMRLSQ